MITYTCISGKLCRTGEGLDKHYFIRCGERTVDIKTEFDKMYSDNTHIVIEMQRLEEEDNVSR